MTRLEPRLVGVSPPSPSPESMPYWEGTRRGELRFQQCRDCGRANFGPGVRCAACQSSALAWHVSAGLGLVYSWTVVWRPPNPAIDVPYAPVIVRLDEGFDMLSALVGLDTDAIEADLRVRVVFRRLDEATTLPFFEPATGV